jgi:hypothetical protein
MGDIFSIPFVLNLAERLAYAELLKPALTVEIVQREAKAFAKTESVYPEPSLYGVDNGKKVGRYLEHKFQTQLASVLCKLILISFCFLLPSCSQQNTNTQAEPSTNSQPIPQQTFTPVTGAFGWKLGESLHSEKYKIEMHTWMMMVSYDSKQDSTILPFEHVIVCATKEGLIYSITGHIDPSQEEYSNVKKGIIDALAEKYQILPSYTPNTRYCEFGDKTNSVELEDRGVGLPPGYGLVLEYKNAPLYDVALSDAKKLSEEEKTRKEQAIRDSLRGL